MIFTGIQDYHNQNLYVRQVDFILMNSIQYPFLNLVKLMGRIMEPYEYRKRISAIECLSLVQVVRHSWILFFISRIVKVAEGILSYKFLQKKTVNSLKLLLYRISARTV